MRPSIQRKALGRFDRRAFFVVFLEGGGGGGALPLRDESLVGDIGGLISCALTHYASLRES
jgi:hypothetical protein